MSAALMTTRDVVCPATMRAVVAKKFGPPEVLRVVEQKTPVAGRGKVLVRVYAAALNPIDWRMRSGSLRWVSLVRPPFTPGTEISGVVVKVGAGVCGLSAGDEVLCVLDRFRGGGCAEYVSVHQSQIVRKPASMSFAVAAAIAVAGSTALQALRDVGRLRAGDRVLINGAAGGVGMFAVQLAKQIGAHVTAVCSRINQEFVLSLGADESLDYAATDFTRTCQRLDLIFDAAAKSRFYDCKKILQSSGVYVSAMPSFAAAAFQVWSALAGGPRCRVLLTKSSMHDVRRLIGLVDSGKLRVTISQQYGLHELVAAHRCGELGHARGKSVVLIASPPHASSSATP
jgi:NADPH:quinone reductase-like Zn-dependent oxidoreductase